MADAIQQITSLSTKSELRKPEEEQDEVQEEEEVEVREVDEEDDGNGEEDEEDEVREDEDEDEDDDDEDEDEEDDDDEDEDDGIEEIEEYVIGDEEEDTCVYDEYKAVDFSEDMLSKDDPEDYRIYLRYAIKTEGFYVPLTPKEAFGVFTPTGPYSTWWPKAVQGAKLAVTHYNKRRAGPDGQLKFLCMRFLNLHPGGCGMLFYITLKAETVSSGKTDDYQTKVWRGIKGKWDVLIFRKDPDIATEMIQEDKALLESLFPGVDVF